MQTAEEWLSLNTAWLPTGMGMADAIIKLLRLVQEDACRTSRRAALVDATKANCPVCEAGYEHTEQWLCQSLSIQRLIAKLDAEVPHGS